MSTRPVESGTREALVANFCSVCHKENANKRCSKCKTAIYCGVVCQKADWPSHKSICRSSEGEVEKKIEQISSSILTSPSQGGSGLKEEAESIWDLLSIESERWRTTRTMTPLTFWDQVWPKISHSSRKRSSHLDIPLFLAMKSLALLKDPLFIDLGAGDGTSCLLACQAGWRVVAVDFSPGAIENILEKKSRALQESGYLEVIQQDLFEYQFPIGESQLIIAFDVLEYCDPGQLRELLRRIYHSLQKGGTLGVTFQCAPSQRELTMISQARETGLNTWYFRTIQDAVAALQESGFRVITIEPIEKPLYRFIAAKSQ